MIPSTTRTQTHYLCHIQITPICIISSRRAYYVILLSCELWWLRCGYLAFFFI